jgi:hypothetical protein
MRLHSPARRRVQGALAVGFGMMVLPPGSSVHAAPPVVVSNPGLTRIAVSSGALSDAIDALARAANFKVTYEGPRPMALLFNTEIETPTVAQTLTRLLDGQGLNYAMVFDLTGKRVTLLLVLGPAPKAGGGTVGAPGGAARPQPFAPPRGVRSDLPAVEDDPADLPEENPQPQPSPSPTPAPTGPRGPGAPPSPFRPPYTFAPRPLGLPPGQAQPSPTPLP